MPIAIPSRVAQWAARHFDTGTFKRGLAYAQEGRVNLVKPDWPVVAQVHGTSAYVVTVRFAEENDELSGDCSCPVAVDCKHAVAAALVAMAGSGEAIEKADLAKRQSAVGEWLAGFALATAPPAGDAGTRNFVAYVLGPGRDGLALAVHRCSRKKRGGYGKSSPMTSLSDPHRGAPSWVQADDLRRVALLRAVARAGFYESALRIDRIDGVLFRDLADSGALFWERVEGRALAYGDARATELSWQPNEGGEFQVGTELDVVMVPAAECHYVDVNAGLIGALDVGVPARLVQRLLEAPPVPPSMLPTVERSLAPVLAGTRAQNLVTEFAEEPIYAELMKPRMVASVVKERWGSRIDVAAQAVYGEEQFALAEWDSRQSAARDLVEEGRHRDHLDKLLSRVEGRHFEDSADLLDAARYIAMTVVPDLRDAGWSCDLDENFPATAPVVPAEWVENLDAHPDQAGWFNFDLGVVVAGRAVPLLPILLAAIRDGHLVLDAQMAAANSMSGLNLRLPDGDLVYVPGDRLQRWLRPLIELQIRGLNRDDTVDIPGFTAVEMAESLPGRFADATGLADARAHVESLLSLLPRPAPKSFFGDLRSYQQAGHAWMRSLHDAGYGGLLADDMGLGKTVQALAFLDGLRASRKLKRTGPALVVAPLSVVGHWKRECEKFAPKLKAAIHHGGERARCARDLPGATVLITSYQTMLRDVEFLVDVPWTTVLFDEAQALKNPATKLRRAAAKLPAQSRFCITGTPIENNLTELYSQMDLAMPGLLGRKPTFEVVFRRAIEKYGDPRALEFLRQRIRPFLMRRTKASVDVELPSKTEIIERIDLTAEQRDLYESLRLRLDSDVREALKARGAGGAPLVVLDALLKLRQVCCDPRLIKTPQALKTRDSAKLERLIAMLEELTAAGRSVLVFSQFTSMLELIQRECERADIGYLKLTGKTRNRDAVVDSFQNGDAPVFLISLKAGGTGLNLTRADTVIHYDPWWNPAAEDQATDRVHRIGQDRNVFVYKLVARGTLEERILRLQKDKRALTNAALKEGGASHLERKDLAALYHELV